MIMTSLDLVVVVAIAPAAVAQHHPIAARPSPLLAVPLDAVLRLRMIGEAMMRRRVVPRVPVLALDVPPPAVVLLPVSLRGRAWVIAPDPVAAV